MACDGFDFEAFKAKVPPGWKFLGVDKDCRVYLESEKHNVVIHAPEREAITIANSYNGSHRERA